MISTQLRDITCKLSELEIRVDAALTAAGVGVWEWDLKTGRLYWDKRMFDIYQINPNDFSHKYSEFRALIHPDDVERVEAKINDCITRDEQFVQYFRIKNPTNPSGWKYIKGKGSVFRNKKGEALYMAGINMESDCPEEWLKTQVGA